MSKLIDYILSSEYTKAMFMVLRNFLNKNRHILTNLNVNYFVFKRNYLHILPMELYDIYSTTLSFAMVGQVYPQGVKDIGGNDLKFVFREPWMDVIGLDLGALQEWLWQAS